jgi:putative hydrolase of HD superfamily
MADNKLQQQIEFIIEIDKLKSIFRRTKILDNSRYENDAEHSWHFAMMALILKEHANDPDIDILKVMKIGLIHDIVEIDAGDTFIYDDSLKEAKCKNEKAAAERIFGLLPPEQRDEMISLWEEYENQGTSEAKFAMALDRLGPVVQNCRSRGHSWKEHNVPAGKVMEINSRIGEGSKTLWDYAKVLIEGTIAKGYFENDED